MEHGHMRCEANISVQEEGKFEIMDGVVRALGGAKLNNKVELKNLNSFRAVEYGIKYEIIRQSKLLDEGLSWLQETRGWNEEQEETYPQRTKESAKDYRYFPEPDIPPFSPLLIAGNLKLPELPIQKRERFREEFGFSYADARRLTESRSWANFVEQVMSELEQWMKELSPENKNTMARLAAGWMTSKLTGILNERGESIEDLKLSPENFAEFIALVSTGRVNSTNAQKLLLDMVELGCDVDPTHIIEEKGYGQISDTESLSHVVDEVIQNNPVQVEQFKSGKDPVIKFLIGMCMKASAGAADPNILEKILREKLQ
jgi:aspartyl-tRNA(Asn)/glutamyl-tRNA(Gln) amidotransferase subunit B